jgi:RNA polymerase sigma factor (sigma-70 family)
VNTAGHNGSTKRHATPDVPYFVVHESFEQTGAVDLFGPTRDDDEAFRATYMPDDVTRDLARRMHYAAWRLSRVADSRRRAHWKAQYLSFRDRIVLGNRKLIYRAVRRWMPAATWMDDMTGDCQIVLIQAVAAYNPWLGIRFSTYAFTCLMRALSRLSQRHTADRLSKSLPLESLPDGEPRDLGGAGQSPTYAPYVDEFLRESHQLLSSREKEVLARRFSLDVQKKSGTLEQVGRELGLSKERVRQVQASALDKLRKALLVEGAPG